MDINQILNYKDNMRRTSKYRISNEPSIEGSGDII